MKKTVFLYGIFLAVMVAVLKYFEYRYFLRELSIELLSAAVAVIFMVLSIWLGFHIFRKPKNESVEKPPLINGQIDINALQKLGISEREQDVLKLLADGHSNQEIAKKLFVSLNTVKTHISNLYSKLDVKRRTQAVQKAREIGII